MQCSYRYLDSPAEYLLSSCSQKHNIHSRKDEQLISPPPLARSTAATLQQELTSIRGDRARPAGRRAILGYMDVTDSSSFSKYLFVLVFVLPFTGCASLKSSSVGTPPPKSLSVTIQLNQNAVTLNAGAQLQFSAAVAGTSNTKVTWSVDKIASGNSSTGTIDATGLYTAPAQAGTHTVTATSAADATKSASATVTVAATPAGVAISPATAVLMTGATQQFTATVSGQANPTITWSVDGVTGGNSSSGTITSAGLYTAPGSSGNHAIAAASSGTSQSASVQISVFTLSVSPES